MIEARELNIGYEAIKKIASVFHTTNVQTIFNLEDVIKPMGASIVYMSPVEFEKNNNFFCAYSQNNFQISTIDKNDNKLKRVLLAQGLGHYILHSQREKIPCKVSHISNTLAAKEGFMFSLSLLLPDEMVIKMLKDGFTNEQISNMFRVPTKIVEIKNQILTKRMEIL